MGVQTLSCIDTHRFSTSNFPLTWSIYGGEFHLESSENCYWNLDGLWFMFKLIRGCSPECITNFQILSHCSWFCVQCFQKYTSNRWLIISSGLLSTRTFWFDFMLFFFVLNDLNGNWIAAMPVSNNSNKIAYLIFFVVLCLRSSTRMIFDTVKSCVK